MAMSFSPTISLVLIICSVVVVVANGAPAGLEEKVKAVCDGTPHPVTCFIVLSPSANASNTADECTVARLAVDREVDLLHEATKIVDDLTSKVTNHHDPIAAKDLPKEDVPCLDSCSSKLDDASVLLSGGDTEPPSRITIARVRKFIADAKEKNLVWSCDDCRHGDAKKKVDVVAKGSTLEKFMEVMYVLVNRVPYGEEC